MMEWFRKLFADPAPSPEPEAAREALTAAQDMWGEIIESVAGRVPPPNDATLEAAYDTVAPVYAAIQEIAQGMAAAEVEADLATQVLLEHPNSEQSFSQYIEVVCASYFTTGVSYAEKIVVGGSIQELIPLRTSEVIQDDRGYSFNARIIPRELLVIVRKPTVYGIHSYHSPLASAWNDVLVYQGRYTYHKKLLTKLPALTHVIESDIHNTLTQRRDLGASIDQIVGADDRSTMVLPWGQKLASPGILDDPSLDVVGITAEANICSAMNVPPIVAGVRAGLLQATYANYEEARRAFYGECLAPFAVVLSRTYTRDMGVPVDFVLEEPEDVVEGEVNVESGTEDGGSSAAA